MSPLVAALVLLAGAVVVWPRGWTRVLARLRMPMTGGAASSGPTALPQWISVARVAAKRRVVRAGLRAAFEPDRRRWSAFVVGFLAAVIGTAVAGWAAGSAAGLAAGAGTLLTARAIATAEETRRVAGVIEAVSAMTAELRAGQPVGAALASAAGSAHPWVAGTLRAAAATAALGGSIPDALTDHVDHRTSGPDVGATAAAPPRWRPASRRSARSWTRRPEPGRSDEGSAVSAAATAMRRLARAWRLCELSGASLADVLDALDSDLRSRRAQERLLAGLLAGPKATGALLAGLPALGLLMGSAMGADPWQVLTGTPTGRIVLIVGIGLETLGLLWTARIVAGARQVP